MTRRKSGGRRKGTPNKATAEARVLASKYGEEAIKAIAALAGLVSGADGKPEGAAQGETARLSALGIIVERAYGKALSSRLLNLELPDTSTPEGVSKAVAAVIDAAARGEMTTGEAGDLCGVLDAQRRAIELSNIEERLTRLEKQRDTPRETG